MDNVTHTEWSGRTTGAETAIGVNTPRAVLIAVGTELTTGQVLNRNAVLLSERLVRRGVEVVSHCTVPDDRTLIREALERAWSQGELVFVTGGLGPTSDDFTREVVAQWWGVELEYHEASWNRIVERLEGLGVTVAESNRQQCYYPRGATILTNPRGTASAFSLRREERQGIKQVWVLPGPPREIEAIWESADLDRAVADAAPGARPLELLTWQCLGKSEAAVGELVEKALEGSGLATGYRAHRPFVEVKVWCRPGEHDEKASYFAALEQALAPWIVAKQGEDLALATLKEWPAGEEIVIHDAATGGVLAERWGTLLRLNEHRETAENVTLNTEWVTPLDPTLWVQSSLAASDATAITLAVAGTTPEGKWSLGLRWGPTLRTDEFTSPWKKDLGDDRISRAIAELAFKRWAEWLRELRQ